MLRTGLMVLLAGLVLPGIAARAASLDKDTCTRLEEEQGKLEQAGVRGTISKGPAWGKANLDTDKLQQVRRLIELDELLVFRCQGKPLVLLPSSVDADPVLTVETDGEKDPDGKAAEVKAAAKAAAVKEAPKGPAKDVKTAPKAAAVKPADKADPAKKAAPAPKANVVKGPPPADAKAAKATTANDAALKVAKPKPAPKKTFNDAYKPPPIDPGENPFGKPD